MRFIKFFRSPNPEKKWRVKLADEEGIYHFIDFGAKGYEDYTSHKDAHRRDLYLMRHVSRENWKKSGILTAGFWSRWLLWNKPSLRASLDDLRSRFDL